MNEEDKRLKAHFDRVEEYLAEIARNTRLGRNIYRFEDLEMLTGFSRGHLQKLTAEKVLPCYRPFGKTLFFDRSEVEAWLKRHPEGMREKGND